MKTKSWFNITVLAGVGTAALVTGSHRASGASGGGDALPAGEIVQKSREAYAALSSYSDSGTVSSEMDSRKTTLTFNIRLQRPILYRIDWAPEPPPRSAEPAAKWVAQFNKGAVWSDGSGDYLLAAAPGEQTNAAARKMPNMNQALTHAAGLSWSAASAVPEAFFHQDLGDVFIAPVFSGRYPLQNEKDGRLGDVDCYVVSSVLDFSKIPDNHGKPGTASTLLWIGKGDFLIHQTRTKYVEKVASNGPPTEQAVDDAIKKSLEMQHKPVTPEAIAAMRPQMREIMKQVQTTLKAGFESGVVTTQTHEDIVVNKKFAPADFNR